MNKKAWRQTMLSRQEALTSEERSALSKQIVRKVLDYHSWQQAKAIALYYAIRNEVDTLLLLKQGWSEGKEMFLPKCFPKERNMTFFKVEHEGQLEVVYMNIPEPKPEECRELIDRELDLLIVPGLVFDRQGYRIGYGGGYYDRYLANVSPKVEKLSLAYSFQVMDEESLPREAFDIPVDTIITDREIIVCN